MASIFPKLSDVDMKRAEFVYRLCQYSDHYQKKVEKGQKWSKKHFKKRPLLKVYRNFLNFSQVTEWQEFYRNSEQFTESGEINILVKRGSPFCSALTPGEAIKRWVPFDWQYLIPFSGFPNQSWHKISPELRELLAYSLLPQKSGMRDISDPVEKWLFRGGKFDRVARQALAFGLSRPFTAAFLIDPAETSVKEAASSFARWLNQHPSMSAGRKPRGRIHYSRMLGGVKLSFTFNEAIKDLEFYEKCLQHRGSKKMQWATVLNVHTALVPANGSVPQRVRTLNWVDKLRQWLEEGGKPPKKQ